jgi:hypothetical protein
MSFLPFFRYPDTRWGAGTGAGVGGRVTGHQQDENIWGLFAAIEALQTATAAGLFLAATPVTFTGNSLTFHFSDGSTAGPFPLPVLQLNPVGEWQPFTTYHYADLFNVKGVGLFFVTIYGDGIASGATFDPTADDGTTAHNLLYRIWAPLRDINYDVAMSLSGTLAGDSSILAQILLPRAVKMTAGLSGAYAYLATAPQHVDQTLTIEKNGVSIGSIDFPVGTAQIIDTSGGQEGVFTFSSDVTFAAGDRLVIRASGTPDTPNTAGAQASDLSVTLPSTRQDI